MEFFFFTDMVKVDSLSLWILWEHGSKDPGENSALTPTLWILSVKFSSFEATQDNNDMRS